MQLELLNKYDEIKNLINILINEHNCIGMKISTEDQGNCIEFIDFINNRILRDILPLNIKIGGPEAKNDIRECLRIGASGIIAPMIESPFGVKKYVTALRELAGKDIMSQLLISINLESLNAYEKIDDILRSKETREIDQIVIGTSDLAKSVEKPIDDHKVVEMVRKMAKKSKKSGKSVRIGGIMSMAYHNPNPLNLLLEETNADKINSANICFDAKKTRDLRSAYLQALNFEIKLNSYWVALTNKKIKPFQKRISSLKKRII